MVPKTWRKMLMFHRNLDQKTWLFSNFNPGHDALEVSNHRLRMPKRRHQINQAKDRAAVPVGGVQAQYAAVQPLPHLRRDFPPQRHANRLLRIAEDAVSAQQQGRGHEPIEVCHEEILMGGRLRHQPANLPHRARNGLLRGLRGLGGGRHRQDRLQSFSSV